MNSIEESRSAARALVAEVRGYLPAAGPVGDHEVVDAARPCRDAAQTDRLWEHQVSVEFSRGIDTRQVAQRVVSALVSDGWRLRSDWSNTRNANMVLTREGRTSRLETVQILSNGAYPKYGPSVDIGTAGPCADE